MRERALGKEHRETASLLITIGNVHNASGDYEGALGIYAKARDVLEIAAGPYHSLTLLTLVGAARSYAALGDIAHAVEYQKRVDDVLEKTIDFNLSMGSARAKLAFADSVLERTGRTISLSVGAAANDRAAVDLAAQVLLQRKGRVQDATGSSLAALRDRMNEGDRRLLDQLHDDDHGAREPRAAGSGESGLSRVSTAPGGARRAARRPRGGSERAQRRIPRAFAAGDAGRGAGP